MEETVDGTKAVSEVYAVTVGGSWVDSVNFRVITQKIFYNQDVQSYKLPQKILSSVCFSLETSLGKM